MRWSSFRTSHLRALAPALLLLALSCAHVGEPAVGRSGSATGGVDAPDPALPDAPEAAPARIEAPETAAPTIDEIASRVHPLEVLHGEATYYADKFEGRRTASGIRFRQSEPYAAHRTLPFGTVVRVTNERNGRSVVVRVVDRGPWGAIAKRRNTIIDLSRSAAEQLGYIRAGRTPVRVEVLLMGSG